MKRRTTIWTVRRCAGINVARLEMAKGTEVQKERNVLPVPDVGRASQGPLPDWNRPSDGMLSQSSQHDHRLRRAVLPSGCGPPYVTVLSAFLTQHISHEIRSVDIKALSLGQPANAQQPNQISTLADPLSDLINGIGPKRSLGPRHDFRRYCSIAVIA